MIFLWRDSDCECSSGVEYGISQSKLAIDVGISQEYLNRIENGKMKPTKQLKQEVIKQLEHFNPEEPLFLLIDYFCVCFPTTDTMPVIKEILHINPKYMLNEDYGHYGYEELYIIGYIAVMAS